MRENLPRRGKVAATFVTMLLVTTLMAPLLPEVTATTVTITIEPQKGHVGDIVRVTGEIETSNGSYIIFFDEEWVKNGTAVEKTVNDTFVVPRRLGDNYDVTLHDETTKNNGTDVFTVEIAYYIKAVVPSPPSQLQEGQTTDIWMNVTGGETNTVYSANITVTDPSGAVYYNDTPQLTNTTNTGYGEGNITYPLDFSGAHTNYTGVYNIAFNRTLASGNFTVGLTNATEYHIFQVVGVRAAGYQANELVWVNITFAGEDVISIQKNASIGGVIEASWEIPENASMGLYTVTIASSTTNGTVKLPPDIQNFSIVKIIPCHIQTKKLNGEVLAGVEVWAYNATRWAVGSNLTNEEGLATFWLEGGNYTFEAEWGEPGSRMLVGTLVNQSIKEEVTLTLWCWVTRLRIAISPPLPLIDITLTYQNTTKPPYVTNSAGILEIPEDIPANISYTIEARRYGLLFYNETLEKLPAAINVSWVNITIPCPTYTMFVHVLDSRGLTLQNVQVAVYEWSSGLLAGSGTTNEEGSVTTSCTFGRYKIRVYNYSAELKRTFVLNETVIDLIEDQQFVVISCKICNLELSIVVTDYFGQPIPKALVKVEREFGQEYVSIANLTTRSNGTVFLPKIGGRYRISVYVMDKLFDINTLYLDESKVIKIRIDKLAVVLGYPLEITHFLVTILLGIMVIAFALVFIYRRLRLRKVHEVEDKEKSL